MRPSRFECSAQTHFRPARLPGASALLGIHHAFFEQLAEVQTSSHDPIEIRGHWIRRSVPGIPGICLRSEDSVLFLVGHQLG